MFFHELLETKFKVLKPFVLQRDDFSNLERVGSNDVFPLRFGYHKPSKKYSYLKTFFDADIPEKEAARCLAVIQKIIHQQTFLFSRFVGFCFNTDLIFVFKEENYMSLDQKLYSKKSKNRKKLSNTELTMISHGIARGIEEIHSKGIYHGDLKVSNIIINDDTYFPIIMDLGTDDLLQQYIKLRGNKRPHRLFPYHYPIERLNGSRSSAAADIYAFGIILYEMSEKKNPFKDCKNFTELRQEIMKGEKSFPFSVRTPSELKTLIKRCLSNNPEERPDIQSILKAFKQGVNFGGTIQQSKIVKYDASLKNKQRKEKNPEIPLISIHRHHSKGPETNKRESNEEELSEIDILKMPNHKNFLSCLWSIEENSKTANMIAVLPLLFDHIGSSNVKFKIKAEIIQSIIQILMNCDLDIAKLYIKHQVLSLITDNDKCQIYGFELTAQMINHFPELISKDFLHGLDKLSYSYPNEFLCMVSLYIKQIMKINDPWVLIDYLIVYSNKINDIPEKEKIIAVYTYLNRLFPSFAQNRLAHTLPFIFNCLKSQFPSVVNAALSALIIFNHHDEPKDDVDSIINALSSEEYGTKACALLMTYKFFPATSQFLKNCVQLSKTSDRAWDLLLKAALMLPNADAFINNPIWLESYETNPNEVYRVFMALYRNEKRKILTKSPLYSHLLKAVIDSKFPPHVQTLTSIIRRGVVDKDLIASLSYNGFLKAFIQNACESTEVEMKHNCMVLLDSFAKISYSPEYLIFLNQFNYLLSHAQVAPMAIQAIVTFSYYKPCLIAFVKLGMKEYFSQLCSIPGYQQLAMTFLGNANRYE